jgi:potassium-transporting ATPase KdpC subunit
MRSIFIAVRLAVVTLIICGLIYPLAMTGFAHVVFPHKSSGSLVKQDGQVVGSKFIGQQFDGPQYFHPRPSANDYDAMNSGGSNLGPTSATLIDRVRDRVVQLMAENQGLKVGEVPVDMVTSSGSGLDPDISPANAEAQIPRVAAARGMSEDAVKRLVDEHTAGRDLGFLGEKRVNVLELNLALDRARSGQSQ